MLIINAGVWYKGREKTSMRTWQRKLLIICKGDLGDDIKILGMGRVLDVRQQWCIGR
jgi:hypothetical protein